MYTCMHIHICMYTCIHIHARTHTLTHSHTQRGGVAVGGGIGQADTSGRRQGRGVREEVEYDNWGFVIDGRISQKLAHY